MLRELLDKRNAEVAREAQAAFAKIAQRNGKDRAEWRSSESDPAAAVRLSASYADLIVAGQPEQGEESELRGLADELGIGAGKLIHPLRVALVGAAVSPGIFDVLAVMGRERTLRRLDAAITVLEDRAAGTAVPPGAGPARAP